MLSYIPIFNFCTSTAAGAPVRFVWTVPTILIFHSSQPIWPIVSPMYTDSITTQCPFTLNALRKVSNSATSFCLVTLYCCPSRTNSQQTLHCMCGHGVCSRQGRPSTCMGSGLLHPSELALALAQLLFRFCTIWQHGSCQRSTTFQN